LDALAEKLMNGLSEENSKTGRALYKPAGIRLRRYFLMAKDSEVVYAAAEGYSR
jgi:hypothetical protein